MKQTLLSNYLSNSPSKMFAPEKQVKQGGLLGKRKIPLTQIERQNVKKTKMDQILENSVNLSKYFNNERSNSITTLETNETMGFESIGFNSNNKVREKYVLEQINSIKREVTNAPNTEKNKVDIKGISFANMNVIRNVLEKKDKMEITKEKAEWELYDEAKRLCMRFDNLENSLTYHIFKKIPTFMEDLKEMSKLTIKDFKQILYFAPNFYDIKWEHNLKLKNDYDINIIFSKQYTKETRKQTFKKNLINHLHATHKEFLVQNDILGFVAEKENKFHPNFDVSLALLVEENLPNRPNENKIIESMGSFLQRAQLKNQHLAGFLKSTLKGDKKEEGENKEEAEVGRKVGLSEKIIQMLKEKDRKMKEEVEAQKDKPSSKIDRTEELIMVAETIKYYCSHREVASVFMTKMVEFITSSNAKFILSTNETLDLIENLLKIVPEWISVKEHVAGKILRIIKDQHMSEVIEQIKEKNIEGNI